MLFCVFSNILIFFCFLLIIFKIYYNVLRFLKNALIK